MAYGYGYPNYQISQAMMPPRQPLYQENNPVIKGRPVSSFEEARASMIDFDGSVFYFPDLANQKIYTKQINLDGTPSIKIYELAQMPTPVASATEEPKADLVTKEEFDETVNNLLQQIKEMKAQIPVAAAPAPMPVPQAPAAQPQILPTQAIPEKDFKF